MKRLVSQMLSVFKYILSIFMIYAGIATAFGPLSRGSNLGMIYENRIVLAMFGAVVFLSGLTLFIGKARKMKRLQGWGLFSTYNCFLFAFIVTWIGYGFEYAYGNLIMAIITGGLYLRWKYHIYYYDPVDKRNKLV